MSHVLDIASSVDFVVYAERRIRPEEALFVTSKTYEHALARL